MRRQYVGRVSAQARDTAEPRVPCCKDLSLSGFVYAYSVFAMPACRPCVRKLGLICHFTREGCQSAVATAAQPQHTCAAAPKRQDVLPLQVMLPLLPLPGGQHSVFSTTWCPLQVVECLPQCCSPGNPPKHAPTTAGAYMLGRYGDTHASFAEGAVSA